MSLSLLRRVLHARVLFPLYIVLLFFFSTQP